MVCGESAERYDDAWTRKSFGCFAGAWWNAGRVGRRGLLRQIFKRETSARNPFVFPMNPRRMRFQSHAARRKNIELVLGSQFLLFAANFRSLREILRTVVDVTSTSLVCRLLIPKVVRLASKTLTPLRGIEALRLVVFSRPAVRVDFFFAFDVAGFDALGLSGVRITHLNTRWARSTVPSLVPVRFAVRPPRSPSRTRRSSPRVAPSSVSRYAESPLRFRALGSIPASPGPSPIATLTTPVLLRDRQQYNRRFVNVVVGLGKKRSPNSNAT